MEKESRKKEKEKSQIEKKNLKEKKRKSSEKEDERNGIFPDDMDFKKFMGCGG